MNFRFVLGCFLLLPVLAAASGKDSTVADTSHFQRWGALPVLGYTEETGAQLGALLLLFFPPGSAGGEGNSVDFAVYGTTRGQWTTSIDPMLRFYDERLVWDISLDYKDWPAHYFGMGNTASRDTFNTYTMTQWRVQAPFSTDLGLPGALGHRVRYGGEIDIEYNSTSFDSLDYPSLGEPGNRGGLRTGLGYNIEFNSTDHENWPRHGGQVQLRHIFFPGLLGKWNFDWKSVEARYFVPLPLLPDGALGVCSFWEDVNGDAPFDRLAQPDGVRHLRGLEKGQYRDRQSWVLHSEARTHLFWRFGGTLYYEAGKVGPYFGQLLREDWHHVVGAGARLAINQSKKLNARVDLSLMDGEDIGLTVYLREAF